MAFSFRVGTNWCHDFPKLARESGFYFNSHTSRVRVDWKRISTIDIDRLIRERDFQTIDENVNNVIDYYLESEYDVKILDPNFVKLFRLAQLAVEYLLYCKQYLDQSVVILKEELKYKLEENVKLKGDITSLQNALKEMEKKIKEKNKVVEVKTESQGEIHKCPHCPKTFVSASFANAHLIRRHSNLSDVLSISSPVHEEYRTETEKLHNEIKTLKERLNQTERVIRSESNKMLAQNEIASKEKTMSSFGAGDLSRDDQYRKYQEEISNLKTMFFSEIRNINRKENDSNRQENEMVHESIKELLSQQENEIRRLRNQLQDHLTSNTNDVESKLVKQEEYWKSKIDQLENQHRDDIENLSTQLKLTQASAARTKSEYEDKVTSLEKQSIDQSKLLSAQSEQLNNLTKGLLDNQAKQISENVSGSRKLVKEKSFFEDTVDSESSHSMRKSLIKKASQEDKQSLSASKPNHGLSRILMNKKSEESRKIRSREEIAKESNLSKLKDMSFEKFAKNKKVTKSGNKYASLDESENSETSSGTESGEDSEEETSASSDNRTESTNDEMFVETESKNKKDLCDKRRSSTESIGSVKQELQLAFERKLRDLGIDPEWTGIPRATYNQKMEIITHHQNISSKRYPKYERFRRKLLEEISKKISASDKSPQKIDSKNESPFNKAMKNVKSKAMKALTEFKIQKSHDTSTPAMSSNNSSPREFKSKRRLSFELLPKKPTQKEIQEIKKQTRLESTRHETRVDSKEKKEIPPRKSNLSTRDNIFQQVEQPVPLQRSYSTIQDSIKSVREEKLDMSSKKVTSTPSKNVKNILLDSYSFTNDSDSQSAKQDALWAITSSKNNKSVLKSTTGTMNSIVKKKVLFDLEKEKSPQKEFAPMKSMDELGFKHGGNEEENCNDSDWNISSVSEEIEKITTKERVADSENIHLKTSQSEKIAEITRKIQGQLKLEAHRPKPAGSVETIFSANTFLPHEDRLEMILDDRKSKDKSTVVEE